MRDMGYTECRLVCREGHRIKQSFIVYHPGGVDIEFSQRLFTFLFFSGARLLTSLFNNPQASVLAEVGFAFALLYKAVLLRAMLFNFLPQQVPKTSGPEAERAFSTGQQ